MTPLRKRMIEEMKLRNFAPKTIELYVQFVARFAGRFGKSPELLQGGTTMRQCLVHLVEEEMAWNLRTARQLGDPCVICTAGCSSGAMWSGTSVAPGACDACRWF